MPEEPDTETKELQDALNELHQEREEREAEARSTRWTRYIALTTAILAVFAAVAAMESGGLVNEAMMAQLRASDTWNEYQASKQKMHIYTVQANALLDSGAPIQGGSSKVGPANAPWASVKPAQRVSDYIAKVDDETLKAAKLKKKATGLEQESSELMKKHHAFARSVALIQVAIALGAIAALTRVRWIWLVGLVAGILGVALLAAGFWF